MAQWSKAGCQRVQVRPLCKIYCVFVGTNDLSKEGMWCLNWWWWMHFLIQIHQVLPKVCVTTHVCVLICHFIFCDNLHTSGMSWILWRFVKFYKLTEYEMNIIRTVLPMTLALCYTVTSYKLSEVKTTAFPNSQSYSLNYPLRSIDSHSKQCIQY